jgi:hypothetical protein
MGPAIAAAREAEAQRKICAAARISATAPKKPKQKWKKKPSAPQSTSSGPFQHAEPGPYSFSFASVESEPGKEQVTITKKGLDLAVEVRTLTERLGVFGEKKFAESMQNGSLFSEKLYPSSILNNVSKILGPNIANVRGTFTHKRNFAADADSKVNTTDGEVVLETDIVSDGDLKFLLSICSPGGFALIDLIFSKAGPELLKKLALVMPVMTTEMSVKMAPYVMYHEPTSALSE